MYEVEPDFCGFGGGADRISGSCAADHPGQKFQISPASLAKPYATPAAGNESTAIPRPRRGDARSAQRVPDLDLRRSSQQCPLDGGGAQRRRLPGRADGFRRQDHHPSRHQWDGKADKTFTFLPASAGFVYPHGLAFHEGYLYVGDLRGIWRFAYKDGQTAARRAREGHHQSRRT